MQLVFIFHLFLAESRFVSSAHGFFFCFLYRNRLLHNNEPKMIKVNHCGVSAGTYRPVAHCPTNWIRVQGEMGGDIKKLPAMLLVSDRVNSNQ